MDAKSYGFLQLMGYHSYGLRQSRQYLRARPILDDLHLSTTRLQL